MARLRGFVLLVLLAIAWPARGDAPILLFSYEVLPSAQIDLPKAKAAPYAQKETLSRIVASGLVPDIFIAVGLDPARAITRVAPGGYRGQTNPSLQTTFATDMAAGERVAAALGYVLRQESVLVSDLADGDGNAYQVTIRFPRHTLTPAIAQEFFRRAALVDRGLGGGYAALDDAMIFLNLRGADGKPYSGLGDRLFRERLGIASQRFPDSRLTRSGAVAARLVENDWTTAPNGEDYARLAGDAQAALDLLRQRHTTTVRSAAKRYGWE